MFRPSLKFLRDVGMVKQSPVNPLIVIVGATGTGKSQLAVDLATRFNGEIINGDAMQLYDGLPIITNKITPAEQKGIPHHLLGIVGLEEEPWRVGRFKRQAEFAIEEIRSRGKLPILVGGTHYYTQSLIFRDVLVSDAAHDEAEAGEDLPRQEINRRYPILERPTEEILEQLRTVDPVMADRWHPNDRRKIQRSMEIYLLTGKPASKTYEEQHERKMSYQSSYTIANDCSKIPNAPLLQPTIIFWVHADPEVLSKKLDKRVDKMLEAGLIKEVEILEKLLQEYVAAGVSVDRSSGIWVSIGFKEFEQYIEARTSGRLSSTELQALFAAAVERTKIATRQYGKRQVKWIRLKLLAALAKSDALDSIYLLDGSIVDHWPASVTEPAMDIVGKFLANGELPAPRDMSSVAAELLKPKQIFGLSDRRDLWVRRTCELCNMTAITDEEWQYHIKGRAHRRVAKKAKRSVLHHGPQAPSNDIETDAEVP